MTFKYKRFTYRFINIDVSYEELLPFANDYAKPF